MCLEVLAIEREAGVQFFKIDAGASSVDHLASLLGGHVDMVSVPYNVAKPYLETGELIVLGNVSAERDPLIPDVPTMKEQGVDLHFSKIYPFFFPKDTPDDIVETFTAALKAVVENPKYVEDLAGMAMWAKYYSPEEAKAALDAVYEFFNTFDEIKPKK